MSDAQAKWREPRRGGIGSLRGGMAEGSVPFAGDFSRTAK